MAHEDNPYAPPNEPTSVSQFVRSQSQRINNLLAASVAGVLVGSYISVELMYFHNSDQTRTLGAIASRTIGALLFSPFSMTIGIFPTMRFYESHGFLVIPGIIITLVGAYLYYRTAKTSALLAVFMGCILWSHNNHLSFSALMSV